MKFRYILGFSISLFSACSSTPVHIQHAHRIIDEYTVEAKKDNLKLFGSGGHFFKQINEFSLDYNAFADSMDIDQARVIILEQTEKLISKINNDIKARQYLKSYPYDENFLYFTIGFRTKDFCRLKDDNISLVSVTHGKVRYSYLKEGGGYVDIYTEPYAEAYQKVYGRPLPARGKDKECK